MVNIALTNHNQSSKQLRVNINIITGRCTFDDDREMALNDLLNQSDFKHPLLEEKWGATSTNVFHYEYDDMDGLMHSTRFVYSTLLRVNNPEACQFKINPSSVFPSLNISDKVYFSMDRHKVARELISISQLESLIRDLYRVNFKFSEDLIIEGALTVDDLPQCINGDDLYQVDAHILELLKLSRDINRYELRYISPTIGFGVFSRNVIKKGEMIGIYSGIKTIHVLETFKYAFEKGEDILGMYLDASQQGNLQRFINHAPNNNPSQRTSFFEANVVSKMYYINGIESIVFFAKKNVLIGEQLLVNYGDKYFMEAPLIRFTADGRLIHKNKWRLRTNTENKTHHIRMMANHGIKSAQAYIFFRTLIITALISACIGGLNHLSI